MKSTFLFLGLLYGVHCQIQIRPKEPGTAGEPKAQLMIQRLTLPVQWVGGLYWNDDEKMLGYPDVLAATYHMWYRQTGKYDQVYLMELVGQQFKFAIPIKNKPGSHLAAIDGEFRIITKSSNTYNVSKPVLKLNEINMKITNGHCDPKGRLFFGTHASLNSLAKLYKVENGELHVMATMEAYIEDLAWSVDFKKLYVISNGTTIWQYSYDVDTGTLGDNRKLAFSIIKHPKLGTTMTGIETDDNGTLWIAAKPEGVLMNVDPKTTEIHQVTKLPVGCTTSITYGGYKSRNLYVGTEWSTPTGRIGEGSVYIVSGFSTYGIYDPPVFWPN